MTDLESPKKNNDCYFYYYSTCSKGDSCGFRHEPSALGCETMCSFWKEGKCLNIHCNFRHMELRKNRKVIPCYWEAQPGGCLKPHCPFMHQNGPRPVSEGKNKSEPSSALLPENCTQAGGNYTSSVDSIVVNFEEESDSESAPTTSPAQAPKVKTLEEIKLEKIAAACAAFYSYSDEQIASSAIVSSVIPQPPSSSNDLRQRILQRVNKTKEVRKLSPNELAHILGDSSLNKRKRNDILDQSNVPYKKRKEEIKIKTLEEIRKERQREQVVEKDKIINKMEVEDSEVTSTSNDDQQPQKTGKPIRRLNLTKIKPNKTKEGELCKSDVESTSKSNKAKADLNKSPVIEESLLLLDDDVEEEGSSNTVNVMKSEDDLFKEIDHFLLED